MKKLVLALALFALAGVALADGLPGTKTPGPGVPHVTDGLPGPKVPGPGGEQ